MRQLVPDQVLSSVLDIDLVALKGRGIKGLLIDLDNTIVRWGESYMEPVFASWIRKARQAGFEVCLVSNAMPSRVEAFASKLSVPSVSQAMKPLGRAFRRALQVLGLNAQEVAVIGDQLFTDVYGGNRLGLYTILINPLSTRELRSTRLMRRLERRLFKTMAKRGLVSPAVLGIRGKRGH
ncbi:MAG TPA: YqeG family HAD IIIA-type phosphatase [Firmicutes bacterium]|jgi:HAD superfamily phosphatase (TIGR01668 family)|nr:YqeG family HAD IIIA-type phosphatase [Bacillota bacterium]